MAVLNGSGRTFYLKQNEDGTWLAATNKSPYLCVEAATDDEAVRVANAAIAFRNKHVGTPTPTGPEVSISAFVAAKAVRSSEPVAA